MLSLYRIGVIHMKARTIIFVLAFSSALQSEDRLPLRSQVELFKGSGDWEAVSVTRELDPSKTALVLCDMWDRHWCMGAEDRVGELARKMEPVIQFARKRGVLIIHAPSETMPDRKSVV